MKFDSNEDQQEVTGGARRFLINIVVPTRGSAEVRSCEVAGKKWRNRTSFTNARTIEDVFSARIADALYRLLGKISAKTRVLSLPDLAIETEGLVLGSVHMITNFAEHGSAVVIMRFKHLIGGIQNAFASAFGLSSPAVDTRDDLALDVLADISLPLLDLCNFSETGAFDGTAQDNPLFKRLAMRAGEIRFQVELIKRYLDGLEHAAVAVAAPASARQLNHLSE